jgi:hypothetical protein
MFVRGDAGPDLCKSIAKVGIGGSRSRFGLEEAAQARRRARPANTAPKAETPMKLGIYLNSQVSECAQVRARRVSPLTAQTFSRKLSR